MKRKHLSQAYNHHWKRFNKRSIVTCHYLYNGIKLCSMYARVIDSYVYQGIRFYNVKPCDSMFGEIPENAKIYNYPGMMLEHTKRRVFLNKLLT